MENNVYSWVTERIIKLVQESGKLPWHKPWNATSSRPKNLVTGKPYRGVNVFLLSLTNFDSPYWVTLKQCVKLGGRVKREEMANKHMVTFWNIRKYILVNGRRQYVDNNEEQYDGKTFLLRYYYVYNVEQCEGLTLPAEPATKPFNPIEKCAEVWENYFNKPTLAHGGDVACYVPSKDKIQMPKPENFDSSEHYYSILFHEAIHSTGHESRLDRKIMNSFGDEEYSKEELVAEMGAAFLCAETGIENKTLDSSAAYIQNWLQKLKDDPKMIVSAASQAEKAAEHILNNEQKIPAEAMEEEMAEV